MTHSSREHVGLRPLLSSFIFSHSPTQDPEATIITCLNVSCFYVCSCVLCFYAYVRSLAGTAAHYQGHITASNILIAIYSGSSPRLPVQARYIDLFLGDTVFQHPMYLNVKIKNHFAYSNYFVSYSTRICSHLLCVLNKPVCCLFNCVYVHN